MKKVRTLLLLAGGLSASTAFAEAGKAFSRISQGQILWAIFCFGFAIPAGLGFTVFGLLNLRKNAKPNLFLTVLAAVLGWWLALAWLFQQRGGNFSWVLLLSGAILPSAFIAFVTGDEAPCNEEESQEEGEEQ